MKIFLCVFASIIIIGCKIPAEEAASKEALYQAIKSYFTDEEQLWIQAIEIIGIPKWEITRTINNYKLKDGPQDIEIFLEWLIGKYSKQQELDLSKVKYFKETVTSNYNLLKGLKESSQK